MEKLALEIYGHLGAALAQSIPADDQIIVQHVSEAKDLVEKLLAEIHKETK